MRMVGPRHFVDDGVSRWPDHWKWGDDYAGQAVVIIGNGPSLAAFTPAQVAGQNLIAINSACRWAAPIATDSDMLFFHDNSWNANHPALADAWPGSIVTSNRYAALRLAPRARRLDVTALTEAVRVAHNIRVLSVATLIGEAINRTAAEESVSSLFD